MSPRFSVTLFALATLTPVPLLVLGVLWGGLWIAAALVYLTVFAYALDRLIAATAPNFPEGTEFPAAGALSVALGMGHFGLLGLAVWAVSGHGGLTGAEQVVAFLAFGLFFGQVSNSNAHELIHRPGLGLRMLGRWVYISLMFGHHASAHPQVHHRFVATPDDPNSAPLGQSFYLFVPKAWVGSFRAGLRAENALRAGRAGRFSHPYMIYCAGGAAALALSAAAFGLAGVLAHLGLAAYATMQLLMSDYVQHYGLQRRRGENGRYEPVSPRHSWNARQVFSSFLMLNAPRHSDHHAHPSHPYPGLTLPGGADAPRLPFSLPMMGVIALFPPLWFRMMNKRARRWAAEVQDSAGHGAGTVAN